MSRDLPPGWVEAELGEIASSQLGKMLDKAKAANGRRLPYLRNVNVRWGHIDLSDLLEMPFSEVEERKFDIADGDLLVCEGGEPGRCAVWRGGPTAIKFQKALHRVRPHGGIHPEWLRYHLQLDAATDQLTPHLNGTTIKHLTGEAFAKYPVKLAPLPEQRRIVERIEALLAKGARAKAALDALPALLDRYRQSLLAAAFRGDLTAEWRDRNPDTVSADALVARNAPPVQPRGGREATDAVILGRAALSVNHPGTEVPPGWSWTPLLRIARQETGHTPTRAKPEYWDGDVPWIGIRDAGAHHGQVIMDTAQHVTELGLENSSARLLPAGTVCLSRTASVGYVTIMGRAMATSQDFATWTCTPALLPKFLMYALMAEGEDIRRFGEGTTHTTIYFPEIRALNICLAPLDEQHEIVRLVEDGLARIDRIAAAVSSATDRHTTLTQSILAKAFRGELVPQDPADEPASVLLERIRAERTATPDRPRRGRRASAAP